MEREREHSALQQVRGLCQGSEKLSGAATPCAAALRPDQTMHSGGHTQRLRQEFKIPGTACQACTLPRQISRKGIPPLEQWRRLQLVQDGRMHCLHANCPHMNACAGCSNSHTQIYTLHKGRLRPLSHAARASGRHWTGAACCFTLVASPILHCTERRWRSDAQAEVTCYTTC